MFRMIFRRKWESAHRLIAGVEGNAKCEQPHGHTWRVEAHLVANEDFCLDGETNLIAPFDQVKRRWHRWIDECLDHSFFFNAKDPLYEFVLTQNPKGRHVVVPGDPTTELMAVLLKAKLEAFLTTDRLPLSCEKIVLHETETNTVEFSGRTHAHISDQNDAWWNSPELTTR